MDFALQSRCKIVREVYKISRDVMLAWFDAARSGDLKTMKQLYKNVAADLSDSNNHHPLVHATGEGTSYGFVGSTVLHWAAANGDIPMMNKLFEWGASPNAQNKGGSTPLHSACSNLRVDSASLLLQKGANPDITDCCNDTPSDVLENRLNMEREEMMMTGMKGAANPPSKKITEEILKMLRLQSLGMDLLTKKKSSHRHDSTTQNSNSKWEISKMRKFVVGCGFFKREEECPKERDELVKVCDMALGHFSLQLDLASNSDAAFEKLKLECDQKLQKRLMDLERKKNQNENDDDDDDGEAFELEMLQKKAASSSEKGNQAFSKGDFKLAVQHYTTAISLAPHDSKYYSNRAAAYLKMGKKTTAKKALEDAKTAASLKPEWAKPYHRWGCAALELGMLNDAVAAFKLGLERAPGDPSLVGGLESVLKALDEKRGAPSNDDVESDASDEEDEINSRNDQQEQVSPETNSSFIPIHERKPWFECKVCENRTRDAAQTPCCGKSNVCGTCVKRWSTMKNSCSFCGK